MEPSWILLLIVAAIVLVAVAAVVTLRRRRRPTALPTAAVRPSAGERLRLALAATRQRLSAQLGTALGTATGDAVLDHLEEVLVSADVGVRTARELVSGVRRRVGGSGDSEAIGRALREEIATSLEAAPAPAPTARPWVVLVTGVNGVGKTTTIGKLAALHAAAGRRVLLVAADTFRAAAIDQLAVWAERTGSEIVRQRPGADPSAVVFDGIRAAMARDVDVALIDTAGRLHTRTNLMEELGKVRRVIARELPGAPHETLLVLDATTGQNAVAQARAFADALGVTGVVLTKLDGTARGGVVIAVQRELGVPIRYLGVGEAVDDLRPFEAHQFVQALFDADGATARSGVSSENP